MQIDITGQNVEVTQALRAYVTEKFEKLERHFENLTGCRVVLRLERELHIVEGTVGVGGRPNDLHAEVEAQDMYAAIDLLTDKLDRQVRRHKDKVTDHRAG